MAPSVGNQTPTPGTSSPSRRLTADERRRAVLTVAVTEFARGGYAGTSTETIADRAGISQPYLFRLFATKRELFLAVVDDNFDGVLALFEAAADGLEGEEALAAMGKSYTSYLASRDLLLLQLHAYAAAGERTIREHVAGRYTELIGWVGERTHCSPEQVGAFFAQGMLWNVVVALGLEQPLAAWLDPTCTVDDQSSLPR